MEFVSNHVCVLRIVGHETTRWAVIFRDHPQQPDVWCATSTDDVKNLFFLIR